MISLNDFRAGCELAYEQLLELAPYDTGNLVKHGIQMEMTAPNECRIYVDQNIAPYMPYTNEVWLSPYWRGKKNPNQGWWNAACELMMYILEDLFEGELRAV